jgi:AraC family transcriptional regulator
VIDEHRRRIEVALRWIAEHLEGPLTVKEVARAARLSEFHFHRLFSAHVGEPVGRWVTRRRLEVAALRLAYEPDRSITEIALASGYSSPSNFAKAFTGYFGCSPSHVRTPAPGLPTRVGTLTSRYGKGFAPAELFVLPPSADPAALRAEASELARTVRFEQREALPVACLASPEGYDYGALASTWQRMVAHAHELGLVRGDAVDAYGIAHDSPQLTAPELCRYHACVPCPPSHHLPAPLFRGELPAGRYAIFRYAGPVAEVDAMYRRIYSAWLPTTSLAPDEFTAIEHYDHDEPVDGHTEHEILIKVRPRE